MSDGTQKLLMALIALASSGSAVQQCASMRQEAIYWKQQVFTINGAYDCEQKEIENGER